MLSSCRYHSFALYVASRHCCLSCISPMAVFATESARLTCQDSRGRSAVVSRHRDREASWRARRNQRRRHLAIRVPAESGDGNDQRMVHVRSLARASRHFVPVHLGHGDVQKDHVWEKRRSAQGGDDRRERACARTVYRRSGVDRSRGAQGRTAERQSCPEIPTRDALSEAEQVHRRSTPLTASSTGPNARRDPARQPPPTGAGKD
jgi:hypothetical protein